MLLQDAFEIAQHLLNSKVRPVHGGDIVICACEEFQEDWVFSYNSRRFLVERHFMSSLVGNGPIVVPKAGLPAYLGASGRANSEQVEGRRLGGVGLD